LDGGCCTVTVPATARNVNYLSRAVLCDSLHVPKQASKEDGVSYNLQTPSPYGTRSKITLACGGPYGGDMFREGVVVIHQLGCTPR
jgi:hypothetical protein